MILPPPNDQEMTKRGFRGALAIVGTPFDVAPRHGDQARRRLQVRC